MFYLGADDTRQDAGYRCKDTKGREMCIKFKNIGYCDKPKASKKCMETCGLCGKYFDLQNDTPGNRLNNIATCFLIFSKLWL